MSGVSIIGGTGALGFGLATRGGKAGSDVVMGSPSLSFLRGEIFNRFFGIDLR